MSWPSQAVLRLLIAHSWSDVLAAGLLPQLLLGRQHYSYGRQHYIIQLAPPPYTHNRFCCGARMTRLRFAVLTVGPAKAASYHQELPQHKHITPAALPLL